ncbi:MAG: 6-phosphogluconolactonase, partial [Campylobacterota bacterium]|nr:6-phosphogluconolactonase [Campylobacterota bacterium]
ICATSATDEPKERITLSRFYLLSAKNLILHIEGSEKKELFEKATHSDDEESMPIISMMQQEEPKLEVYYAD